MLVDGQIDRQVVGRPAGRWMVRKLGSVMVTFLGNENCT